MICPSCGAQNPDSAEICAKCHHRFRFGHAFNDPSKMHIVKFIKSTDTTPTKNLKYFVFSILLIAFLLAIVLSMRNI